MGVATRARLRILVISPSLPYPPVWGFGVRVYQLLRSLSRVHDVSLLTYGSPADADAVAQLRRICLAVYTVEARLPASRKRRAQTASLLSPLPYHYASLHSPAMQAAITRLGREELYDVIQIESSQMSRFTFPSGPALVLDEHNIEYELLYRIYRTERSLTRRLYNGLEYVKSRRLERQSWQRVDACLLTSAREEDIVRRSTPVRTSVVPNGVDLEYFQPADDAVNPASIVFTGQIHYRPNTDAVVHFVREIFPRILQRRPDATFTVVGHRVPAEVQRLAATNVVMTGWVPDVRPYLARAAAVVVPLRMGGGTRLKVLEALAMGKGLVSTTIGCEGLAVQDSEQLLVADAPQAFADAVVRLLDDRNLAHRLGARGRALVERDYGWDAVGRGLAGFLDSLRPVPANSPVVLQAASRLSKEGRA
jgi:sugar transferase (PEP-CTERM/EpsH1 system associated)